MQRSLIIALFAVPTLASHLSYARAETDSRRSAIGQQELATPARAPHGGHPNERELGACAMLDAATDPRLLASAMLVGLNPQTYLSLMQRMTDPQALRNWVTMKMPESVLDKAYSATDPEFQHALLSRASEPRQAAGKAPAMLDPAYFQPGVYVTSKPVQWVNTAANGRSTVSTMNWLDPRTYIGWMRLITVPRTREADLPGASVAPAATQRVLATPAQRY